MWIEATIINELEPCAFLDWMHVIVEPLGGDVVEAGNASLRAQAQAGGVRH